MNVRTMRRESLQFYQKASRVSFKSHVQQAPMDRQKRKENERTVLEDGISNHSLATAQQRGCSYELRETTLIRMRRKLQGCVRHIRNWILRSMIGQAHFLFKVELTLLNPSSTHYGSDWPSRIRKPSTSAVQQNSHQPLVLEQ
jgi:hypothetical protein